MSQKLGEAALPHSHCPTAEVFQIHLSLCCPCWLSCGALVPGTGEQSLMEKQSLGLGNNPCNGAVIPGIRVVILGQIPGTGGSATESSLPKVGQSRFSGSSQQSETSVGTYCHSCLRFPSCKRVKAFSGIAFSACVARSRQQWPLAARWD